MIFRAARRLPQADLVVNLSLPEGSEVLRSPFYRIPGRRIGSSSFAGAELFGTEPMCKPSLPTFMRSGRGLGK